MSAAVVSPTKSPRRQNSDDSSSSSKSKVSTPLTTIGQFELLADMVHALNVLVLILRLWREVSTRKRKRKRGERVCVCV